MAQKRNRRSGVEDRWTKTVRDADGNSRTVPSVNAGEGMRWRARYVDDEGREHAKGFRTKAAASGWLSGIVIAQEMGTYVDPMLGKITFSSFYREWSGRQVWVSATKHVMDQTARSVTFGNIGLADLRPSHFEAWVRAMQDAELKPTTIRTRFTNARTVIRAAVRDRMMGRDVTEQVRLPRARKASAAMAIPTTEEVGSALRTAEGWLTAYVAVIFFAGLRRGEASALQVGDIDFLRKELHVARQVQWTDDGRMEIRAPKYGSERTVYIPDRLVTMLSEHIRLYRPGDDLQRWLFPGAINPDLPVHAATVWRAWRALRAKIGMSHRLHDARHFYASGLIAEGCDVVTVQRALGHASAAQTLSTYSHLWPDANDRTRKAAGDLLDQAFGSTADALRTDTAKTPSD